MSKNSDGSEAEEGSRVPPIRTVRSGAWLWMIGLDGSLSSPGQNNDVVLRETPGCPCNNCLYVHSGTMCGRLEKCPKPVVLT